MQRQIAVYIQQETVSYLYPRKEKNIYLFLGVLSVSGISERPFNHRKYMLSASSFVTRSE